ncbi:MAG: hypothetical protein K0R72_948 [Clostridia bacterium]|jgi:hypothetical protein|nr:hypothetical protein [Clostridia bacterium]
MVKENKNGLMDIKQKKEAQQFLNKKIAEIEAMITYLQIKFYYQHILIIGLKDTLSII